MYHMHTYGKNKCMRVVHGGGFRIDDGFGYTVISRLSMHFEPEPLVRT